MKKMIRNVAVVSAMALTLAGCGSKENTVISYNSPQQWANWGTVLSTFSKDTGIQAPNDNKNSGQTMTALINEKTAPVADIAYVGLPFGYKAVEEDLFSSYKHESFDEIDSELKDEEGRWSTVHYGSVAILVNTKALGDKPVPKSFQELLDPMYKGMVGMYDPTSASVGYSAIVAVNEANGGTLDNFEPALQFAKALQKNGAVFPKQTATAKLMKGEIPILIDADFNGYTLKHNDNAPIDVIIPAEGSVKIPYIVGLVKDAPHEEQGKQLIDFLFSDEGQRLFAEGYVRPVKTSVFTDELKAKFLPDSEYERVQDVDYEKMQTVQADFNKSWQQGMSN
ncbi:MAG: extracellular solute-binding protein [Bacilli bacterium]